ncbi:MAG: zinc-binding dehydrogenase [Dehalococcoidia bacterium]|nr:zinc-binding dehydrogenase [Dehalococcoidia bacterium]
MKAVLWAGPGKGTSLQDIPEPKAALGQVVIQVKASGVCRGDVMITGDRFSFGSWPLVLGHQPAGVISQIGEGVNSVTVGDRVVATVDIPCHECYFCSVGRTNLCRNLKRLGHEVNGSHAEFVVTSERSLIKLPDAVSFNDGAVAIDAVATLYHALAQAQVKIGTKVVLLGIGGMGIQAVEIAHISGASVLVTSRNDARLRFARKLGADAVVNTSKQDLAREVRGFTSGQGADVVVDSIGFSDTMKQALTLLRPGGKLIVVGLQDKEFALPFMDVIMLEAQIIGSRSATKMDLENVIDLIAAGRLHPVIAGSYPLSGFQDVFSAVKNGALVGRAVLIP